MINLTDEEKRRFSAWCMQEAKTNEDLIEQMEKLKVPEMVKQRNKVEASALRVVGLLLSSGEKMEIRG